MRMFVLERQEDVTGVSGTGTVAEGLQFTDGRVALRWIVGDHKSTVTWDDIDAVAAVHGHDGRTTIRWVHEDPVLQRLEQSIMALSEEVHALHLEISARLTEASTEIVEKIEELTNQIGEPTDEQRVVIEQLLGQAKSLADIVPDEPNPNP